MRWHPLSMVALGALVARCGPGTVRSDAAVTPDAAPDVAPDAAPDARPATTCLPSLPAEGAPCARRGLACGYGSDPRFWCRSVATCDGARWSIERDPCPPSPPATCPPSREEAAAAGCAVEGAHCAYGGLACECTNCTRYPVERCMGERTWRCAAPNPEPACPAAAPELGASCTMEGRQCVYGCESGRSRTCENGVWVASAAPGGCPISARRAKRDVRYVTGAERAALAREVGALRLATYEYADPALAGRRRLGFMLDDQSPASFAADPERSQVDLYGYASMLVAAAQEQQRRIDALQREVDALRAALARRR